MQCYFLNKSFLCRAIDARESCRKHPYHDEKERKTVTKLCCEVSNRLCTSANNSSPTYQPTYSALKVIVNDITVEGFRDKKVMTFIAEVTEDELMFRRSESSDRFVIGDISIRVYLDGTMGRSSNGDLSGRIIIDAFDTGAANTSLNLYNCDFTFTKK